MYMCVRGIGFASFYDYRLDFRTVTTVWYFRTVTTVWYFVYFIYECYYLYKCLYFIPQI